MAEDFARAALAQPARARTEPVRAIHEARLVLKRFRALLLLVRAGLGDPLVRRAIKRLRAAAKPLSVTRDAAVGLATLEALRRQVRKADRPIVDRVRERFAKEVHDAVSSPASIARHLAAVARTVRATARTIQAAPWQSHGWRALGPGLQAAYRRTRRRYRSAMEEGTEEAFHAWRTAAKALMYQASYLRRSAPRAMARLIRPLDEIQGTLGDEHDLAVLSAHLIALRKKPGRPPSDRATADSDIARVLAWLASRQRRLRKFALRLGRRHLARRPRAAAAEFQAGWKAWRRAR